MVTTVGIGGPHFMTLHEPRALLVRVVLLLLPIALVAGCRVEADVAVRVADDGSGTLAVALATDEDLAARAAGAGGDPIGTLADAVAQLPGWTVERDPAAGGRAVRLATTFADPEELERVSAEFAAAVAAPELRPLGPLRLVLTDDTVELRGSAGLAPTAAVADVGLTPRGARRALDEAVAYTVTATLPGDVLDSDADRVTGTTQVRWAVAAGQERSLRVLARRPWTWQRVAGLLVTPPGLLALVLGLAMVVDWHRATRDLPPPLPPERPARA